MAKAESINPANVREKLFSTASSFTTTPEQAGKTLKKTDKFLSLSGSTFEVRSFNDYSMEDTYTPFHLMEK